MANARIPRPRWRRTGALTAVVLGMAAISGAPSAAAETADEPHPGYDATWGGDPFYTETQLAANGEGPYPYYRIPALTVTNDGDVLASFDGRPNGGDAPNPNSILQRRSTDNGQTWGEITTIAEGHGGAQKEGYSDPSYIVDRVTGDIFNFHVYSMDAGFRGSQCGTDEDDRNVIQANVARSSDGGRTWSKRTITAEITDDADWCSRFASSGQGIQLKYGPHAGHLIQQFLIVNEAKGGAYQAVSVYSDDHGKTWHAGEPVGTSMDENKTVELSDGTVMMNSRDSSGSGYRKVAYSHDGGVTWTDPQIDTELPDPTNNGSIIRAFPNAEEGSPEAQILLFSNASSQTSRSRGVIRMSCDDGETWPISKVFREGAMSYSTLATLPDGNIGLLYEPGNGIRFAKFNLAWLGGVCAGIEVDDATGQAGESSPVAVTVTNQMGSALQDAEISLDLPTGWSAQPIALGDLAAGETATATIEVHVPDEVYPGQYQMRAVLQTARGSASSALTFTVPAPQDALLTVVPQLGATPDAAVRGAQVEYDYTVSNVSEQTLSVVPSSEDLVSFTRPGKNNCGWQSLQPGESYTCTTAHHVLTEDDLEAGAFSPHTTWEIRAGDYAGEVVGTLTREGPTAQLAVPEHLVPQSQLGVADVSSEETANADNAAVNALDGNPATFWHTDWSQTEGPHWITLDLGRMYSVQKLRYRPRPGAGNGTMKQYEVYTSVNGKYWGQPVATGTLERSAEPSVIELPSNKGRYLKIVYVSSYSDAGRHFASAAGFNLQAVPPGHDRRPEHAGGPGHRSEQPAGQGHDGGGSH